MKVPDVDKFRDVFVYCPDTGIFTWKYNRGSRVKAGSVAGTVHKNGYRYLHFDKKKHFAHRVAYLMCHGVWPEPHTDHINGKKDDNRICNLRACSSSQNLANRKKVSTNSSGFKGVGYCKAYEGKSRPWIAQTTVQRKYVFIGYFASRERAANAYDEAAYSYFGEFARFNYRRPYER